MLSPVFFDPILQSFLNGFLHGSVELTSFGNNCSLELLEQFGIQLNGESFFLHANHVNGSMAVFMGGWWM